MQDGMFKVKRKKRGRRPGEVLPGDYFEYALLRLAAVLIRVLPLPAASALGGAVFRRIGPATSLHKRALRNLALAFPDLDAGERQRIAVDQWDNLGRTFAESLMVDRIVADPARVELAIPPELDRKLRAEGGHIIVSMHSANWEVAALPERRYRDLAGLYQQMSNPLSDRYVRARRRLVFNAGVFTKGPDTPALITKWVRDGNAMAMLADHRESRGVAVTMFGRPASANPFPAMLARRLGALLIAGRAVRLPGSRFRVEAVEIPVPSTEDAQADAHAALQAIQDRFELWIRDRPGEWMWVQDRWRAEPLRQRAVRRTA